MKQAEVRKPDEQRIGVSANRNEQTAGFWSWAEAEADRAPNPVLPLIERKVARIIVTQEEAAEIHRWARGVIGWDPLPKDTKPIRFSDRETGGTILDPPGGEGPPD